MDLKIFKVGFTEQEFNDFCDKNIIYKFSTNADGSVYVFYKNPQSLGKRAIELVEDLDRMVKQLDAETLTHKMNVDRYKKDIEKLNGEKEGKFPNQDEWKKIEQDIRNKELSIKMSEDTIDNNKKTTEHAFERLGYLLK